MCISNLFYGHGTLWDVLGLSDTFWDSTYGTFTGKVGRPVWTQETHFLCKFCRLTWWPHWAPQKPTRRPRQKGPSAEGKGPPQRRGNRATHAQKEQGHPSCCLLLFAFARDLDSGLRTQGSGLRTRDSRLGTRDSELGARGMCAMCRRFTIP